MSEDQRAVEGRLHFENVHYSRRRNLRLFDKVINVKYKIDCAVIKIYLQYFILIVEVFFNY